MASVMTMLLTWKKLFDIMATVIPKSFSLFSFYNVTGLTYIPVDSKGVVDYAEIVKAIRKDTILISIMLLD